MGARKLDQHIKEAFTNLGFSDEEIMEGCWLLERGGKPVAWIALHKFLERVAMAANIKFDEPKVFNCQSDEIALYVRGSTDKADAWSIGEASPKNNKNEYRWAMAEKRAKDRVILKLVGVAGYMYSEEEADDFKKKPDESAKEFEKSASQEKSKKTRALNNGTYTKPEINEEELKDRFSKAMVYASCQEKLEGKSVLDRFNSLIRELDEAGMKEQKDALQAEFDRLTKIDDEIIY